jgi:hypothetical protein
MAFLEVDNFLAVLGIEARLRAPLKHLVSDIIGGSKPPLESWQYGIATAAIDALLQSSGPKLKVADAAKQVAKAIGANVKASKLVEFRKNFKKERVNEWAKRAYRLALKDLTRLPPDAVLAAVRAGLAMGNKEISVEAARKG